MADFHFKMTKFQVKLENENKYFRDITACRKGAINPSDITGISGRWVDN